MYQEGQAEGDRERAELKGVTLPLLVVPPAPHRRIVSLELSASAAECNNFCQMADDAAAPFKKAGVTSKTEGGGKVIKGRREGCEPAADPPAVSGTGEGSERKEKEANLSNRPPWLPAYKVPKWLVQVFQICPL